MNPEAESPLSDSTLVDISRLQTVVKAFATDRGWEQYHQPRNLLLALVGEVGELSEIFQWLTDEQSQHLKQDSAQWEHLNEEIADVFIYLTSLITSLGIDLDAAVKDKLLKNARKYPVPVA